MPNGARLFHLLQHIAEVIFWSPRHPADIELFDWGALVSTRPAGVAQGGACVQGVNDIGDATSTRDWPNKPQQSSHHHSRLSAVIIKLILWETVKTSYVLTWI
jgi:hypothetical protein